MNRNVSSPRGRALAMIATGCFASSCATAPEHDTASTVQAVGAGSEELPDISLCDDVPSCSVIFSGGYDTTLQRSLQCGETYLYNIGPGSRGSFCPNLPGTLIKLHNAHRRGFHPGYCSRQHDAIVACLNVPADSLFVIWSEAVGPGCPSTCSPTESGSPF
jgi:hypothetical protein